MSKVMPVNIDGCKITPADGKRGFNVQRVAVFMVQGNECAIAEWRDDRGNLQMAKVASLNLPMAPASATAGPPAPKTPKPEPKRAPAPPKKPPKE
jgi:hypothetical protein